MVESFDMRMTLKFKLKEKAQSLQTLKRLKHLKQRSRLLKP